MRTDTDISVHKEGIIFALSGIFPPVECLLGKALGEEILYFGFNGTITYVG